MTYWVTSLITLWLAATLEYGLPERLNIAGASPDFILICIAPLSMLLPRAGACGVGFFGGVIQGAIVGANLTHYTISRTLTGFMIAWSRNTRIDLTVPMAGLITLLSTLFAGLLFMFGAAPRNLGPFLLDTIGSAVYNGVLAMPLYALLRRILGEPSRRRG